MTEDNGSDGGIGSGIDRRTMLKSVGAAGAVVVGGTAATGTAAAGVGDGRVLDYHLNNINYDRDKGEIVSNFVHDASPADNDGEWEGDEQDPVVKDGAVGNAFRFDGKPDAVRVPDSDSLDNMSEVSVAAWVNFDDVTGAAQTLIRKDGSYILQKHSGDYISFAVWDDDLTDWAEVKTRTFTVDDNGTWFHVAGVFDGEDYIIYLNGTKADSYSTSASDIDGSSTDLGIGRTYGQSYDLYLNGKLDETRVYNRTLSSDEVEELYEMKD